MATPDERPPGETTPQSTSPSATTPQGTPPSTTTPPSTPPSAVTPSSVAPPAVTPQNTPPATTGGTGTPPSEVIPSAVQPTSSSTGVQPPIEQPTTSSTGIQPPIVQPTTSSTGVTEVVQPTTSSTGITPYVTPSIPSPNSGTPATRPVVPGQPPVSGQPPPVPGQLPAVVPGQPSPPVPEQPLVPPINQPAGSTSRQLSNEALEQRQEQSDRDAAQQLEQGRTAQRPDAALPLDLDNPVVRSYIVPQSFADLLELLGQERDDWNAKTLQESLDAGQAWLNDQHAANAALRPDPKLGAGYGVELLRSMEEIARELIGPLSWVGDSEIARVTRVDKTKKVFYAALGGDAQLPAEVANQRPFSYGLIAPAVGKTLPVHFPVVLPPRGSPLTGGPVSDPQHLPWGKVNGETEYWLYYEIWNFDVTPVTKKLYRLSWPLEHEDGPLAGELVRFPAIPTLMGWHVGARSVVTRNGSVAIVFSEDWGFGDATVTGAQPSGDAFVSAAFTTLSQDDVDDVHAVPVLGTYAPTIDVPSGVGPPGGTIPYASTVFISLSRDSGASWADVQSFPSQGSEVFHEEGIPYVPRAFAQLTNVSGYPGNGFVLQQPCTLGPTGTRLFFYCILRVPDYTLAPSTPPVGTYSMYAMNVDTGATQLALPLGSLRQFTEFTPEIGVGTQAAAVRQTADGGFVIYVLLESGLLPATSFFAQAIGLKLVRMQGPWDNLVTTQIGQTFYICVPAGGILISPDTLDTRKLNPAGLIAVSEDGQHLLGVSSGNDVILFPSTNYIYSTDFGNTWQSMPATWQDDPDLGTGSSTLVHPALFVPISSGDARAVRGDI